MSVLTVASIDPILHVLAPISLAAAAGTAVVLDLDPDSGWPFTVGSLGELVAAGPTADDLHPTKSGVALLGGPVTAGPGLDSLVEAFQAHWPAVVIRSTVGMPRAVRIDPALPWLSPADVKVRTGLSRFGGEGIPAPPIRLLRRILGGEVDPRWRWFRHWRPVWELAQ